MTELWNRYDLTAARTHGTPGRLTRPATTTIDIHAHLSVPAAAEFVKPHLDWSTIPLAHFVTPETRAINQGQEIDRADRMSSLTERLGDMDAMGVDRQLVMPTPFQCYYTVPLPVAVSESRTVNDGIAAQVEALCDRFVGLGTVPLQDGRSAVAELTRCVTMLGLKGVQILTNVGGRELSDPEFAPFWAKAEELGALVVLHPNGFTEGKRLTRHYFNNVIGNPFETTLALHHLIFDGVLERHPDLKILAVHGGGYLASYSGRIDHAWGARSDSRAGLPRPPSEYLRRIHFDSVVFTPHQLKYLIDTFGVDRIVMGTDYAYDMAEYDPIGHVRAVPGLTETAVEAITGGNAKRLLGL